MLSPRRHWLWPIAAPPSAARFLGCSSLAADPPTSDGPLPWDLIVTPCSIESTPSQPVGMEAALEATEKNGFTIVDVTPDKLTFTMFTWRPPQAVEDVDTMKPALVYEVPRKT